MPDNFYQIADLQQSEGRLNCTVSYNAAHLIFKGHFPGQPVVPGACTMDMIKELLEGAVGKKLLLRSTGQVKFLQLILPEIQPQVSLQWEMKEDGYAVTAGLKAEGKDVFKMNAVYQEMI
jgi:3-hydroxyacyl-[acyl-carrier-protein] dehydratase